MSEIHQGLRFSDEQITKSFAELASHARAYSDELEGRMAMAHTHEFAARIQKRESQISKSNEDPNV